jgi:hypothetical protein
VRRRVRQTWFAVRLLLSLLLLAVLAAGYLGYQALVD